MRKFVYRDDDGEIIEEASHPVRTKILFKNILKWKQQISWTLIIRGKM